MNQLYSKGREGILDRSIDMTGDIRVMLVRDAYRFDDTDRILADLGKVDNGRSESLENKAYAGGVFDAAGTSLVALEAVPCSALALFQHTGDDRTARLIAYIGSPAAGLPCTPSGGQTVNITWDTGLNKIFKL